MGPTACSGAGGSPAMNTLLTPVSRTCGSGHARTSSAATSPAGDGYFSAFRSSGRNRVSMILL